MASQSLDDLAQQYLPISPITSKADREYIQLHHYSFKEGYQSRDTEVSSLQGEIKTLVDALSKLAHESMASDYNEHWDSYKDALQLISKYTKP